MPYELSRRLETAFFLCDGAMGTLLEVVAEVLDAIH